MSTFIALWNPDRWPWSAGEREMLVTDTEDRLVVNDQWPVGTRKSGIRPGDTAYLFQHGHDRRGIIASGTFTSGVFQVAATDGDGPKDVTNYANVAWDRAVRDEDMLPAQVLDAQVGGVPWLRLQGSGAQLHSPHDETLAALWRDTLGWAPEVPECPGWQSDSRNRRLVEDHAQRLLVEHYRSQGYEVTDARTGNPFDAVATRGPETVYLEAKGTTGTEAAAVQVTRGEVEFARANPGRCVMGIVTGVRLSRSYVVDPSSGELRVVPWDPDAGELVPRRYTWEPDA